MDVQVHRWNQSTLVSNQSIQLCTLIVIWLFCTFQAFGAAMADPDTKLQDAEEIPACTITNRIGVPIVVKPGSYYEVCWAYYFTGVTEILWMLEMSVTKSLEN